MEGEKEKRWKRGKDEEIGKKRKASIMIKIISSFFKEK